jgi:hypothetical protein
MYEIKFENLELQKKYYIETNKGKFRHCGYFRGFINDLENPEKIYGIFINVERIKINKNSIYYKCFVCQRDKINWKYYVPQKDTIVQKFEKNNIHLILRNITNDPSFSYY